ncbi:MAG: hypothetical protein FJ038_04080 [Chloroflexi bacterium]|nr:hypothetical protein [Chloroflexota bacterium]
MRGSRRGRPGSARPLADLRERRRIRLRVRVGDLPGELLADLRRRWFEREHQDGHRRALRIGRVAEPCALAQPSGELALHGRAYPVTIIAKLTQDLVHFFGQHRLGQVRLGAQHRATRAAQQALWPSEQEERRTAGGPDRLDGIAPDLGRDVRRGPCRRFESLDLVDQLAAAG